MALGTFTVDSEVGRRGGYHMNTRISFLGDTSYPTGGTAGFKALVAAALGIENPDADFEVLGVYQQNLSDNVPLYDRTNDKLLMQVMSTGVEVANAVNLSGITFEVVVLAR